MATRIELTQAQQQAVRQARESYDATHSVYVWRHAVTGEWHATTSRGTVAVGSCPATVRAKATKFALRNEFRVVMGSV